MTEELHPSVKYLLEHPTDEDEKVQELRRASFTRANLTDAERTIARGLVMQETAMGNLLAATEDGNKEQIALEQQHLADGLVLTGDYAQAAKIHPIKEERARLRLIRNAIERDDDAKLCTCKPERAKVNGVEIDVPTTHISQMVFSKEHGEMVGLEACRCGKMNARPLTGIHARVVSLPPQTPDIAVLRANE